MVEIVECRNDWVLQAETPHPPTHLSIGSGKDIPPMDRNGKADPYLKVTILPERKPKFETKVKRNELSPVYNEAFLFQVRQLAPLA